MTESINVFAPDMVEAVAEYMARYEKGSGRVGDRWENEDIRQTWRRRALNAISTVGDFIFAQSGHWNAPRREWFADIHESMAKSMFFSETRAEEFPDEEQRDLWRSRAHWAMLAIGDAMPRYAERS